MASSLNPSASLAPMSAEDDGTHGNQSVPAMLRSIRELLNLHIELVTQSRASLSEESLSTVMGTLKQGKTKETSRVELLEGFDSLRSLLSGIAEEVDRGILQAEAISHSLIRNASRCRTNSGLTNQHRRCSKPSTRCMSTRSKNLATQISLEPKASRSSARTDREPKRPANPGKGTAVEQFETHMKFLVDKLTYF